MSARAVVVGADEVSHAELQRLAGTIRAALAGRSGPVAGYFDHSVYGVAAFLAVLGSGCWYVPLAPVQGAARVAAILRDCGADVVLTDLPVSFSLDGVDVIRVDRLGSGARDPLPPHDIAYAIYTSGSTGTPKGVLIGHQALATSTAARVELYGPGGSLFLAAPFCFDSSVSMFGPLTTGGTVILSSPSARHDAVALAAQAARATQLLLLPSVYAELLEVWGPDQPPSLAVATVAGEVMPAALVRRHFALAPGRRLVNEYGPTEATVFCLAHECVPSDVDPVPIGRPVRGYRARLVDGEIWVSGGLSAGYLHNPALTAEKFVEHDSGRWYRTGDLGRERPDGSLEFLGRFDDQVKVRGVRVELSEVDALLAAQPGVTGAAAVAVGDRLVGYVSAAGPAPTPADLRAGGAADFLVPHAIHVLDEFPRTPSGKVDRRALTALAANGALPAGALPAGVAPGGVAPSAADPVAAVEDGVVVAEGPLGALLVACADVLGMAPSEEATFLDHGDSLAAMRVGVRMHRAGWSLDPMSLLMSASLREVSATARPRLATSTVDGELGDLSPSQMGIWFAESLARGSNAFTVPLRLRFDATIDPVRLERALRAVVERHPVLGCRIGQAGRRPVMVPHGEPMALEVVTLPSTDFDAFAAIEAAEPIDLRAQPPLRAVLLVAPGRCELLLTLHHMAFDGWSKGILVRDLAAAHGGATAGHTPPDFRRYAAQARADDERRAHAGPAAEAAALLAETPTVLSLRDPSCVDSPRLELAATIADLEPALRKGLEELAARRACTVFTVLLAGFAQGLCRATGTPSMVIGTVSANRPSPEYEESVGMFTNVVPVALDPGATPDVVGHTRERLLAALRYAGVPFHRVVEALAPPRDPRFAPVVQVLFEYFAVPAPTADFGPVRAELDDSGPQQGAVCDFSLRVLPRGDGLRCIAVHDASVVAGPMAHRVLASAREAWQQLAAS